jgi:DNA-binding response OmpR family regulator
MTQKRRILILEDDSSTLNLIAQIVARAGYEPILARRGREGLQLLQDTGADLVLLDIMMKDMDGWAVLKTIRADPSFGNIPVLIVSARTPGEHPSEMEAHAGLYEAYFVKPFEVDDLVVKIAEMLASGTDSQGEGPATP